MVRTPHADFDRLAKTDATPGSIPGVLGRPSCRWSPSSSQRAGRIWGSLVALTQGICVDMQSPWSHELGCRVTFLVIDLAAVAVSFAASAYSCVLSQVVVLAAAAVVVVAVVVAWWQRMGGWAGARMRRGGSGDDVIFLVLMLIVVDRK